MSSRPPVPQTTVYLRPSTELQRVVIRSEVGHFVAHWDPGAGRSVPCSGSRCEYCSLGYKKLDKYLIAVDSKRSGLQLLELRRAQYVEICSIWDERQTIVGAKIDVWKSGALQNSKVCVELRGWEQAEQVDLHKLLSEIGANVRGTSS